MTKKNSFMRNVVAVAICLAGMTVFFGCEKPTSGAITVTNEQSLTQEVYADNEQGSGVSFNTTGAWTSSISEVGAPANAPLLKAETSPDWIDINPSSGDKAGNYTLNIILEPNTTGSDRTAVITVLCNGQEIKITVTQKGEPSTKGLLCAHSWKHISTKQTWSDSDEEIIDNASYIITFNSNGTYTTQGYSASYTLSGNTLTFYAPTSGGGSEAFTITNINDNVLDLKRTSDTMTKIMKFIKN